MINKTNENQCSEYVSCIKVAGVNMLPPLITPEKRRQLQDYKRQAIRIEKQLKRERELREYIRQHYDPSSGKYTPTHSNRITPTSSRPQSQHKPGVNRNKNESLHDQSNKSLSPKSENTVTPIFNEYKNHLVHDLSSSFECPHEYSECQNVSCQLLNAISHELKTDTNALESSGYVSATYQSNLDDNTLSDRLDSLRLNVSPINRIRSESYSRSLEHQLAFDEESIESIVRNTLIDTNTQCLKERDNDQDISPDGNKSSDFDSLNIETIIEASPPKSKGTDTTSKIDSIKQKGKDCSGSPGHRLIRSNSYTLDTPSPILLQHIQHSNTFSGEIPLAYRNRTPNKSISPMRNCSSLDANQFSENCNEKENIENVLEIQKQVSPASQGKDVLVYVSEMNKLCIERLRSNDSPEKSIQNNSPQNKSTETMISKANTYPTSAKTSPTLGKSQSNSNISPNKVLEDVITNNFPASIVNESQKEDLDNQVEVDPQLQEILEKLPENYSKKIMDILEKQKSEMKRQLESSTELRMQKSNPNISIQNKKSEVLPRSNSFSENMKNSINNNIVMFTSTPADLSPTFFESVRSDYLTSSQSIYFTMSSSTDTLHALPSPTSHMTEAEIHSMLGVPAIDNAEIKRLSDEFRKSCDESALKCSKELFPVKESKSAELAKRNKAASVIGATAKGYLTRRLLRTDRVQSLILTIKEALICAMELHSEDHANIQPADVELHRRLIQQVSAACFEFHDVFFALPISEQMLIISQDRQRQLEKLKRPLSSSSRRTSSSQGSTRSRSTPRVSKTSLSSKKSNKTSN